jgi:hypothetical protein
LSDLLFASLANRNIIVRTLKFGTYVNRGSLKSMSRTGLPGRDGQKRTAMIAKAGQPVSDGHSECTGKQEIRNKNN